MLRKTLVIAVGLTLVALAAPVAAQDEPVSSVATLFLADGTRVPLLEWQASYEFLSWKKGENVTTARPTVAPSANLIVGKKSYPLKDATLGLTHADIGMVARVVEFSVNGIKVKPENPDRELVAPGLDKKLLFQARSFDISGKTLSGTQRMFCIASLSALVDCGTTESTRVVKVEFR